MTLDDPPKQWFDRFRSDDVDWIVGDGAEACWTFAMLVQPALDDLEGAVETEDTDLAYEAALMALRGCYSCVLVATHGAHSTGHEEIQAAIALSEHPLAGAIRSTQSAGVPDRSRLTDLRESVVAVATALESALPFRMPLVRRVGSAPLTMRLAATLTRIRGRRDRGALNWRR